MIVLFRLVLKFVNKSNLVILKQSGNYRSCQVLSFYACGAEICVSQALFLLGQVDLGGLKNYTFLRWQITSLLIWRKWTESSLSLQAKSSHMDYVLSLRFF